MLKVLLVFAMCIIFTTSAAFASSGSMNEVVENDSMQVYVYAVTERPTEAGATLRTIDVELIVKNVEPSARVFNLFFAKMADDTGREHNANPLMSTILPIRIASNDILNGRLTFTIPMDAAPALLVWAEPDEDRITVDLTSVKDPSDPILQSNWTLNSKKGITLGDGRTELTIHEEAMSISPTMYLVDISLKNLSKERITYSSAYAFVKDEAGYLYPMDVQNIGLLNNPLLSGELEPGQSARGAILFLLPDHVNRVMLIYDEETGLGSYFAVVPEFPFALVALISSISFIIIMKYVRRELF